MMPTVGFRVIVPLVATNIIQHVYGGGVASFGTPTLTMCKCQYSPELANKGGTLTLPDSTAASVMTQKPSTIQPRTRATKIKVLSLQLPNTLRHSAPIKPCVTAFNMVSEYV